MYPTFDSRNQLYKSTLKAVTAGTPLRLRLLLHNPENITNVILRIYSDSNAYSDEIKLLPEGEFDNGIFYGGSVCLPVGLYWYDFRYQDRYGCHTVGRGEHHQGATDSGIPFQLTVCSPDFKTPDWLKGGIIYQIFPDRFHRSKKEKIKNIPAGRCLRSDWNGQPAFRQDTYPCSLENDYFGGNLDGITEKLDYLVTLGVSCIYLNPIFESHSNHRYNTADYMNIDPLLGDTAAFERLCRKAKKKGISIILDGVFSHTGDDSVYFNKYGSYGSGGAYNSQSSKYFSWYKFRRWPDDYVSWWGVPSLPETNENDPSYTEFICGENGVLRYWMRKGVAGWRLDVADELPDAFLDSVRKAVKAEDPDAFVLGEVWEDASNKVSYGARRRYLLGGQLDSVMNYPFANGVIAFVTGGNSRDLIDLILEIIENYPDDAVHCLMNHIGTHDTARILSRLGALDRMPALREEQSRFVLSREQKAAGKKRLKLAVALQYTLPGIPSVFYGDEAGCEGGQDPFCRCSFPWDSPDEELISFYRALGKIRRKHSCFANGDFIPLPDSGIGHIAFLRRGKNQTVLICVNRWCDPATVQLPEEYFSCEPLYGQPPQGRNITAGGEDFFIGLCK